MRVARLVIPLVLALVGPACKQPAGGSGAAPIEDPFVERSDAEVSAAFAAAKDQARREGKRVLLEFVAPWCSDCREVARISREEPAASVLREKYVVVAVNVGRFDRSKELLREYEVKEIAALVVVDAEGKRIARTTLEPITKKQGLSPEDLAMWLRSPRGSKSTE